MNGIPQPTLVDSGGTRSGQRAGESTAPSHHTVLSGTVEAVHQGLTRISVRLVTGNHTRVRVRWPEEDGRALSFRVGQKVLVRVPADAVCLEAGLFRQGRRRWNRWIGRVVLVQQERDLAVVTVKLHGDDVIVTSTQSIGSRAPSLQTWDTVNVVIDPSRVTLHAEKPDRTAQQAGIRWAWHADRDARIWLRARLTDVQQTSEGHLLSLDLGGAYVSAQIAPSSRSSVGWVPGERVDVQVGVWEAWIKRAHDTMALVPCRLLHLAGKASS